MTKKHLLLGLFSIAVLTACKKDLNGNRNSADVALERSSASEITGSEDDDFSPTDKYVPNQLLVKFKRGTSLNGRENALARVAGKVQEQIVTEAMKNAGDNEGVFLVHVSMAALEAVNKVKGAPEVEYAEPNYILRHIPYTDDSNDPYYNGNPNDNLWGMMGEFTTPFKDKYGSRAGEAWSGANGSIDGQTQYGLTPQAGSADVYVGVIDEGIKYNHEDLIGQVGARKEIAGNKKDDDGNGYIDDAYGWNFVKNNNAVYTVNQDAHGTHVAGTIGAIHNNKGVAGVNKKIGIISAKFLGTNGGTTANAIKAIDYLTNLKYYPNSTNIRYNIVATNNSWGGGAFSQSLKDAISRSEAKGILFIAAAGNDSRNIDISPSYPASYGNANIISVASITPAGQLSSFSNYGQSVNIAAPGSYIWSTTPNGYSKYSGTSMATPHVTGAVALYAAANNLTPGGAESAQQIKLAILNSARPTATLIGKCTNAGRLDVHSAWRNINNSTLTAD